MLKFYNCIVIKNSIKPTEDETFFDLDDEGTFAYEHILAAINRSVSRDFDFFLRTIRLAEEKLKSKSKLHEAHFIEKEIEP